MKLSVVLAALTLSLNALAAPVELDFEGISTHPTNERLNDAAPNYGGFNWNPNFYLVNENHFQTASNNSYDFPSGDYGVYNASGMLTTLIISRDQEFDFLSAYFSAWGSNDSVDDYSSPRVTVFGYDASYALVGSKSLDLSTTGFDLMTADLFGVTRLEIVAEEGRAFPGVGYWIMDNFKYQEVSAVPLPAAAWLFSSSLVGLFVARRRQPQSIASAG